MGEPHIAGFRLELSALQALCRHVFAFRLAMIAISAPIVMYGADPGPYQWAVGAALLVTFMTSYALFRDWERLGPLLLRHPLLLLGDTLFAALLLLAASPDSPLAYLSACTPLLAGLVYGGKGAAWFTVLQAVVLAAVLALAPGVGADPANSLLLPGFYAIAGWTGTVLRRLLLRFGEATQALGDTRAKLAAERAVGEERARVARELHDTVAKTLAGVALAAEGLADSVSAAPDASPEVRSRAALLASSARQAAAESRALLGRLRAALGTGATAGPCDPVRELTAVVAEALDNAERHAGASKVVLTITVTDDGHGLPDGVGVDAGALEPLCEAGHFGLIGMAERVKAMGARLSVTGPAGKGTEVRVELPLGVNGIADLGG
ncbi:histidine kinase [Streptomyces sp. RB6PN25]|uniref:Histidine kinase n=1 Tax=Streptomyces humicola TaxID=2953240 RepID=A0ABT1PX63_9ACTN|nr:histidine kinase [Streptomyces humicola]MCQ4082257.1 histidine kinase [Streptomyces humicola]